MRTVKTLRSVPRLANGDRLTRAELERRYHAVPEVKKAELLERVVYTPSPVTFDRHAKPHADLLYSPTTFPGLVLNIAALLSNRMAAVLATLQDALGSSEHRAFVERLGARGST